MNALRLANASLWVLVLAGCQTLDAPKATVVGTGDPAKDVPAIQAAVDGGGTVALRGTFNFGERERVSIRRDVTIVGRDGARINGGFWTFFSPLPDMLPPRQLGPKIAIRDIHFDGALWAPIHIAHASALVVSGNRITNVRAHPLPMQGITNGQAHQGVIFGTGYAQGDPQGAKYLPDVFIGTVEITDNVIDMTNSEPTRTLGNGVFGKWTTGIEARIARNKVTNASRNAIEAIDHYRGSDGKGRVRVEANTVTTPSAGLPWPSPQTPNAIVLGFFWETPAAIDPARNVKWEVERNVIELQGATSRGITVLANGAEIKGNRISARGGESQLIVVPGSNAEIAGNVLAGAGRYAIGITPFRVLTASGNRLTGNDLRDFKAAGAQIVFGKGAANNVCAGHEGLQKVADEGSGNRCP